MTSIFCSIARSRLPPKGWSTSVGKTICTFYAETAEGPYDRLFVSSTVDAETVARYLPEIPVGADGTSWPMLAPPNPKSLAISRVGKGSTPTPVPSRTFL